MLYLISPQFVWPFEVNKYTAVKGCSIGQRYIFNYHETGTRQ